MPLWITTICETTSLSTILIGIALLAYLANLYVNSNSRLFRKSDPTVLDKTKKHQISFTSSGVIVNYTLSIISIVGILLTFADC